MDELQLIKTFRSTAPQASDETRRRARALLAAPADRPSRYSVPLIGRRRVLVWVTVALLAGLLAGTAFAFGGRLLDFVRGGPAPKSVQLVFKHGFGDKGEVLHYFNSPDVIKSRLHGVLAFPTKAGPVALWAAPTRGGGVCFTLRPLKPKNFGEAFTGTVTCVKGVPLGLPLVATIESSPGGASWASGIARKDIVRVEVHLTDGSVHRARVYEHFFGVGVPPGSQLASAVGFDANEHKVGTYSSKSLPKPKPPRPVPARTGSYRKVFDARLKVSSRSTGEFTHRVVFAVAPAAGGGLCTSLTYNGQPGEIPSPQVQRHCARSSRAPLQLLGFGGGGPPEWGFAVGRARADVATVQLRFEDGTTASVRLTAGRFFLVLPRGLHMRRGYRPRVLNARDRANRVLARLRLDRF